MGSTQQIDRAPLTELARPLKLAHTGFQTVRILGPPGPRPWFRISGIGAPRIIENEKYPGNRCIRFMSDSPENLSQKDSLGEKYLDFSFFLDRGAPTSQMLEFSVLIQAISGLKKFRYRLYLSENVFTLILIHKMHKRTCSKSVHSVFPL